MVTLPLAVTVKPAITLPLMITSPWTLMLPVERSTSPEMLITLLTWNLPPRKEICPSILEMSLVRSSFKTTFSPWGRATFLPLYGRMGLPWMLVPGLPWVGCTISQITVPASMWVSQFRLSKSTMPCSFSKICGVPTVRGKYSMVFPSTPGSGGTQAASCRKERAFSGAVSQAAASWSTPKKMLCFSRASSTSSRVMGKPSHSGGSIRPQAALKSGAAKISTWPSTGRDSSISSRVGFFTGSSFSSFRRSSACLKASWACLRCCFITAEALLSTWEKMRLSCCASGASPVQKSSAVDFCASCPWAWQ